VQELSVVIPTFNERENIEVLVPRIQQVFRDHAIDGEIIIVDDRSSDGSHEVLTRMAQEMPNVRVRFREPPNSIARSWHEGFSMAAKENIVCIDADLCHDPNEFPRMLRELGSVDIVIGSRYMAPGALVMKDKSKLARYTSYVGQYITRFTTGFTETDTSHSFRMFKRGVFEAIKGRLSREGNVFLIEFLMYAKREGFRVTEIPIEYGKRIYGETKLKVFKEGMRYLGFIARILLLRLVSRRTS